ncbi:MAG: WXG100 family type VII secretion target [Lachnospiraceae bacterium]|nr:WXG100 family type VII secretion target [Lachnospiraceae bacterium]
MAVKEIEVDTNTLARDIKELSEELEKATKCIQTMTEDMAELDSMWDGPANEAFMVQFGQDTQYAQELCSMVQKLTECMEYARTQYDICDNEVSSLVASI